MLSPKLRFKGFSSEWKSEKLEDLGVFKKGKGLPKSDITEEGHPCIRYGELYTYYGEVISEAVSKTNINIENSIKGYKNDVLIPSSGETAYDIATASALDIDDIILGGDINIFTPNNNFVGKFIAFSIDGKNKFDLMKYAEGASVVHLYNSELKKFKMNFPSIDEQKKIADFFTLLDCRIKKQQEKVEAWREYKKGMMQKLFSRELRFRVEDGGEFPEWEETQLKNIVSTFSGGTPNSNQNSFYTGDIPFIRSGEISSYTTQLFINDEGLKSSSAKLVEIGDLLYALYGATSGEVAISKISGAINQAVLCIRTKESKKFLLYYLRLMKESILSTYLQGGQGNLSAAIVKEITIPLPSIEEQEKIAYFLSTLDKKIDFEEEKLNRLQEQKKGFLQKMFI